VQIPKNIGVKEGSEVATNCSRLKLMASDGKMRITTEISKEKQPKTFLESKKIARKGGDTAKKARKDIEQKTGKSAISAKNAKSLQNKKIKKLQ